MIWRLRWGLLGEWDDPKLVEALGLVAEACRRFGKCFGVAGIYHRPDSMDRFVNEFGARYMIGAVDVGLLGGAMRQNSAGLRAIQRR
jgi:2-keto-3-deoxy-L-rhamnonate aldolase RhmA